jgi:hypothetical protein
MRRSKLAEWALAAAMVVAAVPGMAQQSDGPILLPKPKPVAKPAAASATLLVTCDLACNWKLDSVAKGRIEAGGSAKVKVEQGEHIVIAATEDGLDKVQQLTEVKAAGQKVVSIALQPVCDARLKAEQEARDKAAQEAKAEQEAKDKAEREARDKAKQEETVARSNDPASPHAPGIYLFVGTGADRKLVPLEPCEFNPKVNGMIMINIEAIADGPEAKIQTSNTQPEFYFYFDNSSASRNPISLGSAVSPSDFALFHFTVKGGKRDALVMKQTMTAFSPSDRDHITFNFSRIGPGAYKVTLPSPLKPGEYGFLSYVDRMAGMSLAHPASSNANSSSWIFDFGVPGIK